MAIMQKMKAIIALTIIAVCLSPAELVVPNKLEPIEPQTKNRTLLKMPINPPIIESIKTSRFIIKSPFE